MLKHMFLKKVMMLLNLIFNNKKVLMMACTKKGSITAIRLIQGESQVIKLGRTGKYKAG